MQLALFTAVALLVVVQPQDSNLRVHDFANLLTPQQREQLETVSRDVERKTTAQIAVVTVNSLDGRTVDSYANELFQSWGIGQRQFNNGVLFLVAPHERRMRIEPGYGVEPLLSDSLCGEIADTHIVPHFKRGDYAAGIIAGTNEIASVLSSDPAAARGDPNSGPHLARTAGKRALFATVGVALAAVALFILGFTVAIRRLYSTTTFLTVTAIGAALVAVAAYLLFRAPAGQQPFGWFGSATLASFAAWSFNLVKYRRFGPRGCSKCATHLELLSEQDDDPKLSTIQRLEEKIGSVNYDVWFCPACLNNDTERYIKHFSGFSDCPACGARTFKEDPQRVVRGATKLSSGLAKIDGRCVSCNHKTVRSVTLPRITTSSSSSSGSFGSGGGGWSGGGGGGGGFGGGSSGGGGASRGW
jgi:uncharacterized protein